MLVPHAPYTVFGRLLEINPRAADYEDDVMSWIGRKKGSFFIEDIEPKSLRLIKETTKNERIASKGDMNCFCPTEDFVDVDTENLTTQTNIILELKSHFSTCHCASYTKCKLGEPAFKFCSGLIREDGYENYPAGSKEWLQKEIEKLAAAAAAAAAAAENQIKPNTKTGAAEKLQRLS